jgi:hypothetical protein
MKKILKYSILVVSLSLTAIPSAHADRDKDKDKDKDKLNLGHQRTAPEIDPSLALSGLALLAGSLSVVHARRSKG